jgi:hypothetical protein
LDSDTIDHNDKAYESFKEVLAVLSFHRMGKSSQKTLEGNKKHKLSTLGKCILHNKNVGSVVHDSLEAYVFIYLKGKMQLSPDVYDFFEDPGFDPDEEIKLLESVQEISEIVHFVGKPTKGGKLPTGRHVANDKLVWSWTDPIYHSYKKLMRELQEYNLQSEDKFFFEELDEKTLADYATMNRHRDDQQEPKVSSQDRGECVSSFVDFRFPDSNPGTGGGNQPPKKWYPNFY